MIRIWTQLVALGQAVTDALAALGPWWLLGIVASIAVGVRYGLRRNQSLGTNVTSSIAAATAAAERLESEAAELRAILPPSLRAPLGEPRSPSPPER